MRSSSDFFALRSTRGVSAPGLAAVVLGDVDCAYALPAKASASAAVMDSSLICMGILLPLRPSQQPRDERDQEQHDEHDEQDLRDFRCTGGDAGEAEDRGHDRDDEKCQRPAKHDSTPR